MYGCENRVLSTVFGPKSDEVTGKWSKQHNEEVSYLYGACCTYGERTGVYKVLVRKLEGKGHLEDLGVDGRIFRKKDAGHELN
jgi:hypothetical protein